MAKPVVRLRVVQAAFGLGIVAVLARAIQVQIIDGDAYAEKARTQHTEQVELPARRGGIYDRNGVPIALTQDVYHVDVTAHELRARASDTRAIAKSLGLPYRQVERSLRRRYAYFNGPFTSTQVQALRGMRGVYLRNELVRFHPDPGFARPVIGRPGASGRAASGIERVLDSALSGIPGKAVVLRDGQGRRFESPSRLDAFPVPGHDVYLTIDSDLQEIVDRALLSAIDRYSAEGGDVVVLDPRSGELLAVASRREDGSTPPTAFTSVFEPGSTAKMIAAAALLTDGLVRPADSVWGERGVYDLGIRKISDDHPQEWMSLTKVIQVSSNIGIVKFSSRLTPERLYGALRDFGFGAPTGVEFPAESRGLLARPVSWSGTTAGSLAMGYEVAVTPLQLAQAYGAVANDGVLLQPTLIRSIRSPNGDIVYEHRPEPVRRAIPPEIAERLRGMLRGAVLTGGTGAGAALTSDDIAGKTGTSQRTISGAYVPGFTTATFASIFPADDPQLVLVVKLDAPRGGYAALTAAPLTRSVLEQVLAARTGAIDRSRLKASRPVTQAEPTFGGGTVPFVVEWPRVTASDSVRELRVPNVVGLSLRPALRRLHGSGLQVRISGWGRVTGMSPGAGTTVRSGALITLTAER